MKCNFATPFLKRQKISDINTIIELFLTVLPPDVLIIYKYYQKINSFARAHLKLKTNREKNAQTVTSYICFEILNLLYLHFRGPNARLKVWNIL